MRTRVLWLIAAALAVALSSAAPSEAATVTILLKQHLALGQFAGRGAVGLVVPGAGPTVTRAGALASLVRGRVVNSVVSAAPGGEPMISLGHRPAEITIYLSLPPPGRHHNTRRYPIALVGGGYRGLLVSQSTRIPGLLSIADVAPTARALERGDTARVHWRADADAPTDLRRLDDRLARVHAERDWATLALVALVAALLAPALLWRSQLAARAALLAAPAMVSVALVLSALGVSEPLAALALAGGAGAAALVAGSSLRRFTLAVGLFVAGFLVVLVAWPEVNALAAIGPHPDGGVRFYGITNQVETVLLAPVVAAVISLGSLAAILLAALTLVVLGWSRAGADGGGLLVYGAAFLLLLAFRLRLNRPSRLRLGLAVVTLSATLALVVVALDAATGGSSHVIHAVAGGPRSLAADLGDRLEISWASATSSLHAIAIVAVSLTALVWFATRSPRTAALGAFLGAIVLSLLVNDTPVDVAGFGALLCAALWAWQQPGSGPIEPSAAVSPRSCSRLARRPP